VETIHDTSGVMIVGILETVTEV